MVLNLDESFYKKMEIDKYLFDKNHTKLTHELPWLIDLFN